MPAIRTLIDGVTLATVSTEGYSVISVRVSGTRIEKELATIEVTGGVFSENEDFKYLIWATDLALQPNQTVTVQFLSEGKESHPGKTIDEQYPNEAESDEDNFEPTAEMFAALRTMPTFRETYAFRLEAPKGQTVRISTKSDDRGFAFSVVWNSFHPERAQMSLHSYTIESMEARSNGDYHAEGALRFGDEVHFALIA